MKLYDSHVHVGQYNQTIEILKNSIYKKKYRLYSSIDPETMKSINCYIRNLEGYFAMPIIFKEINISSENKFLHNYCKNHKNAIEVPLINESDDYCELNSKIYKEHFLIHDYNNIKARDKVYSYLNKKEGFLILHSKDAIRREYVVKLVANYPNINIIIAHMGRDVWENYDFCKSIIDNFYSNERIYFDTSTITNKFIIQYGIEKIGSDRILFGTDYPYEKFRDDSPEKFSEIIYKLDVPDQVKEKIIFKNAKTIGRYCKL